MGDYETGTSVFVESTLRYHPSYYATLTQRFDYKRNRARDEKSKKGNYVQFIPYEKYIYSKVIKNSRIEYLKTYYIQSVPSNLYYSHLLANENKRKYERENMKDIIPKKIPISHKFSKHILLILYSVRWGPCLVGSLTGAVAS